MIVRFFVLCLFVPCTFAAEITLTGQQWLEKMNQAMKTLNYQGTIAFVKNGDLDTMQYFHQAEDGQEKEKLLSLNSPIRDVVRENRKVRSFYKDIQTSIINHRPSSQSFILNLPTNFAEPNNSYSITVEKEAIIANRLTHMIFIKAKDDYRYGRKIWIDNEYFLPLKIEIHGLSNQVIEQVVFTEIKVGDDLPLLYLDNDANIKIRHVHQARFFSIDDSDLNLDNIPPDFKVTSFSRMSMGRSEHLVEHLLLSDGFSSVSIYKERAKNNTKEGQHQTFGIINSYTQSIKNNQITVMGDAPAKTVQFIAQGIQSMSD